MQINTSFLFHTFVASLHGIPVSLFITVSSFLLSALPAFFVALARVYRVRFFSALASAFVSFTRGTPVVVRILIVYSLFPSLINAIAKAAGCSFNVFAVNPLIYAVIVFTMHNAAGLSEVFRSAILTVDKGQMDASRALGMKGLQAFYLVILPQSAAAAIPNICNLTVDLFKETSLAFLMTVKDITAIAKIEAAFGYNYIESYIDIFFIYIIVCSVIQVFFFAIERALEHRC